MTSGPMQVLVVGFAGGEFKGEIAAELDRLREQDVARVVDMIFVTKLDDGTISTLGARDPAEEGSGELGALAADLVGVADMIAPGTTAAVAVIEHRWAIPLRAAIERAGGMSLADEWLHPEDLVAADAMAAALDVGAAEAAAEEGQSPSRPSD